MLETAILVVMVIVALAVIGLILVQQGKGADMGASFGSGASNTVFGSQGSGNFLTRTTSALAAVFFVCCLALAWFANHRSDKAGNIDFSAPATELKEIPVPSDVPAIAPAPSAAGDMPATPAQTVAVPVAPSGSGVTEAPALSVPVDAATPPATAAPVQEQKTP